MSRVVELVDRLIPHTHRPRSSSRCASQSSRDKAPERPSGRSAVESASDLARYEDLDFGSGRHHRLLLGILRGSLAAAIDEDDRRRRIGSRASTTTGCSPSRCVSGNVHRTCPASSSHEEVDVVVGASTQSRDNVRGGTRTKAIRTHRRQSTAVNKGGPQRDPSRRTHRSTRLLLADRRSSSGETDEAIEGV